jgi:hypothetical protein
MISASIFVFTDIAYSGYIKIFAVFQEYVVSHSKPMLLHADTVL